MIISKTEVNTLIPENELKRLVQIVADSAIHSLQLTTRNGSVTILNSPPATVIQNNPHPTNTLVDQSTNPATVKNENANQQLVAITSPSVGTFYSHEYGSDEDQAKTPFVSLGQIVTPGVKMGVVRAMHVNSDIVSNVTGTIVCIGMRDGETTDFGRIVFTVDVTQK